MNSPNSCADETFVAAECAKHGAYQAKELKAPFPGMTPFRLGCPKCVEEARERKVAAEAEAKAREEASQIAAAFHRSGIPPRFADRTLENYTAQSEPQKRALRTATRFAESLTASPERGASLILCGSPGTGKTHLACAIGRHLTDRKRSVIFSTVIAAIRHVKETYRRDSERTESEAIEDMLDPSLLILDEVGVQIGSDHEKLILFEIINERYQNCRSTILISNLDQVELAAYLGERIMDRFREAGGVVAFDWASYRGKAAS